MWRHPSTITAQVLGFALQAVACGGSEDSGGSAGSAGSADAASPSGGSASGTGGSSSTGGTETTTGGSSAGAGGSSTSTGGSPATGGSSSQPIGSICVADDQCTQAGGTAVCCTLPGCEAPCECRLEADCDEGGFFLECSSAADCVPFGGGKVCCKDGSMQYCTKPSGCAGETLP